MEIKAKLSDISFTPDGKERLTFTLNSRVDVAELKDKDLRLTAKRWREKRSLSANAYFYVLAEKIARASGQSITEIHNQMIADYGQIETIDGHLMPIIIRDDVDWRKIEGVHVRPTGKRKTLDDGNLYHVYLVMRGSHTYDSAEMARLIDGTISEAQALGLETITPNQKEEMIQRWGISA